MEKKQAAAIAAVLCRAIDYLVERQAEGQRNASPSTDQAEAEVAAALEAIPDES